MSVLRALSAFVFALVTVCTASAAERAPRAPAPPCKHESMVTLSVGTQTPRGSFHEVAQAGSMVGLSAGYRAARKLALGVDCTYLRNPGVNDKRVVDIFDPGTQKVVNITLAESWAITRLGGYAKLYCFERGRWAPYLLAGAGTYSIRYAQDVSAASATTTVAGVEQVNKAGINAGAGLRGRVVGGTSLGFEAVYHQIIARNTRVNLMTTAVTIGFGPTGN